MEKIPKQYVWGTAIALVAAVGYWYYRQRQANAAETATGPYYYAKGSEDTSAGIPVSAGGAGIGGASGSSSGGAGPGFSPPVSGHKKVDFSPVNQPHGFPGQKAVDPNIPHISSANSLTVGIGQKAGVF